MKPTRTCSLPDCDNWHSAKGYCRMHYLRILRNDMTDLPRKLSPYETVMARSQWQGGCLIYEGPLNEHGYGAVGAAGTAGDRSTLLAHRVVLEHHHGASKLITLHSCDIPACVNIDHIEYGTHSENMLDAARKGRLNTRLTPDKVRAIRADTRSRREIAYEYEISEANVSAVKRRLTWDWVM